MKAALLLLALAHGAPAPLPRPAPAREAVAPPALYRHYRWPAYPGWTAYLCHGGRFVCFGPGGVEEGVWRWDGRSLEMREERPDGHGWAWGCPAESWREHLAPAD